jgi:3-dehydroquinate synthase
MSSSDKIVLVNDERFRQELSKYTEKAEEYFILADTNTTKHCFPVVMSAAPGIDPGRLITVDAGEEGKNISTLHHIWSTLLHDGAGKNTLLLNLGGGMISDIGGFAAATYKRGIPYLNIPTSLLGMVDAAIGGKTAINIGGIKNQAGTFWRAEAVIIYPPFLASLDEDELLSGKAEMLKTAIVADRPLFDELSVMKQDIPSGDMIKRTAMIKNNIVMQDLYDRAERQCLNYGHSIGHALEALCQLRGKAVKHGLAVAAGILCEAYIATKMNILQDPAFRIIEKYINATFPPLHLMKEDIKDMLLLVGHDKKNYGGAIRMSLPSGLGKCTFGIAVEDTLISESLEYYATCQPSP